MDGNIKVGKVSMTALIEKDIIRLNVTVGEAEEGPKLSRKAKITEGTAHRCIMCLSCRKQTAEESCAI
jgi:hypothetical protein